MGTDGTLFLTGYELDGAPPGARIEVLIRSLPTGWRYLRTADGWETETAPGVDPSPMIPLPGQYLLRGWAGPGQPAVTYEDITEALSQPPDAWARRQVAARFGVPVDAAGSWLVAFLTDQVSSRDWQAMDLILSEAIYHGWDNREFTRTEPADYATAQAGRAILKDVLNVALQGLEKLLLAYPVRYTPTVEEVDRARLSSLADEATTASPMRSRQEFRRRAERFAYLR